MAEAINDTDGRTPLIIRNSVQKAASVMITQPRVHLSDVVRAAGQAAGSLKHDVDLTTRVDPTIEIEPDSADAVQGVLTKLIEVAYDESARETTDDAGTERISLGTVETANRITVWIRYERGDLEALDKDTNIPRRLVAADEIVSEWNGEFWTDDLDDRVMAVFFTLPERAADEPKAPTTLWCS